MIAPQTIGCQKSLYPPNANKKSNGGNSDAIKTMDEKIIPIGKPISKAYFEPIFSLFIYCFFT